MNKQSADTNDAEFNSDEAREMNMESLWPQVRKLLVFQLKLYIDAFRDLLLSALSLGAFLIDLIQQNEGPDSYFERVLKFGRRTERSINLFNHFDVDERGEKSVDSILDEMEEKIRDKHK